MKQGWTWLNDKRCPFHLELQAHYFIDGESLCGRFSIENEDTLKHGKDDVAICPKCRELSRPVEQPEDRDRSYPHCDELECKERDGGSVYCRNQDCDTRRIFVTYDESIREDPKPSPPELERWGVIHGEKGHYRLESTKGKRIALSDAIPLDTAKAMAGATQMRDALRMVRGKTRGFRDRTMYFSDEESQVILAALENAG